MKNIYSRNYKGIITLIIKDNIVTSLDIEYITNSGKLKTKNILINNNDLLVELKEGQKVMFDDINEKITSVKK